MYEDRHPKADEARWLDRYPVAAGVRVDAEGGAERTGGGISVSYARVLRMVRRHRTRTIFATEQDRVDVAIAHDVWRVAQAWFGHHSGYVQSRSAMTKDYRGPSTKQPCPFSALIIV